MSGARASAAVPGRGGLVMATLAGWLPLSQRTGPVAIPAIGAVVLASTGSVLGARPLGLPGGLLAELDAQGYAEGLVA